MVVRAMVEWSDVCSKSTAQPNWKNASNVGRPVMSSFRHKTPEKKTQLLLLYFRNKRFICYFGCSLPSIMDVSMRQATAHLLPVTENKNTH